MATFGLCLLPETHLPRLELHQGRESGHLRGVHHRDVLQTMGRAISLPTKITGHLPVFLILLLIGIFNGLVNMILSSLGSVYQNTYHFSVQSAGLAYLGLGLGGLSSLAVTRLLKQAVASVSTSWGFSTAETSLVFLGTLLPISAVGLLWYGWAVQSQDFWIVPIIGLFFFGFGWMATRVST